MGNIKILIFDRNKLYKDAIATLLKDKDKIKSVFSLSKYDHVFTVFNKFKPDLVLINCQNINNEKLKSIVINLKKEDQKVSIFIIKGDQKIIKDDINKYIDLAISPSKDQNYLYSMIKKYVNPIQTRDKISDRKQDYKYNNLTDRELDVINLISKGMSNKKIAEQLMISERTVKNHVSSILQKLSVDHRTQALIECIKKGIVKIR
ncbi:MAG: response regulator transcription factor [Halanaerobiales bacterium]|nr:response regulator transcription factor [Halanaerobiales bacterium]